MKSILVIEDNAEVRENVCEILELSGYTVYGADHGAAGVELAIKQKPDLVLCDVMMPRLDGYGVLKILRANKITNHIPFIFLTARVDKSDFRKGMGLGADDYITKPFDDTELLDAIETRLNRQDLTEKTYSDPAKSWHSDSVIQAWVNNIKESREIQHLPARENLYTEGDRSKYIYLVDSGLVRETEISEDGKSLVVGLYGKNDFFGFEELFQNESRSTHALTISSCKLYRLRREEFIELLGSDRLISKFFLLTSIRNLRSTRKLAVSQAYSSVRKKVAEALLTFHEHMTEQPIVQPTREDLSLMAGVAKETLIRTLTAFKSEKLIDTDHKKIYILNVQGLKHLPQ